MRRVRPSARALSGSARARRLRTIHPERLGLAPEGEVASAFGCGFALADVRDRPAPAVERLHRHRAQVEERLKDAELGQPLPSGDANASRPWMTAVLAALDLAAMPCDPSPLAGACGAAREDAPLRRHAKALRRALPCLRPASPATPA